MRPQPKRELFSQCKNKARTMIVRAPWPLTPIVHAQHIAKIRHQTNAPADVAESAYNEALKEVQTEMVRMNRNGRRSTP